MSRLGRLFFDAWYWSAPTHRAAYRALDKALPRDTALVHANDWNTLPLALRLAARRGAKVVLDLHEYAPLEFEERPLWRLFYSKPVSDLLRRSAGLVDASVTVAPQIAERLRLESALDPITIFNAPSSVDSAPRTVRRDTIRLIHHGGAQRARQLELMIDAVAIADERFMLDFMLIGNTKYVDELRRRAEKTAPGRIHFRDPVSPEAIGRVLAEYDVGIYLLRPTTFNMAQALPNKLFDFVGAGLAAVVGPAPAMAAFVRENGIGVVTRSFDPAAIAMDLNRLTASQIEDMRAAARVARQTYNADVEMQKLLDLYRRLLD